MKTNRKFFEEFFPVIFLCILLTSCEKRNDTIPKEVQDIDGNSYAVICFGEQLWMAENLKTTRFNDGSDIPFIPDNQEWSILSTPGYCWYNNDADNKSEYGALYNWYAVDSCKICPEGWHVPSDEEWTELEIFLENNGYNYDGSIDVDNDRKTNNKIGKAMTSTTGWTLSDIEGAIGNTDYPENKNLTGFNVLPGGYRNASGVFMYLNLSGNCWSTAEYNSASAWYRRFLYDNVEVSKDDHVKRDGFSVRCVKYKDPD
jgi:uncharacterized protein (TIGR02145 family)